MTSNYSAGTPLVSVLLPVYNGSSSIGETIESALCQTYRNIELIVVDDGSTDQTNALVQQYADRDPRVKIIRQENRGVAAARNRGLAAARGEFVAPLDADDLWEPTKIELQVRRILEAGPETGLIYCWWVWIDGEGVVLDRSPSWRVEGDGLEMLLRVNYTGNASVPLIRRTCLEEVGGYDETLRSRGGPGCEDWDAALRVAERYKVSVVPELLVGYRRRAYSMSTNLTGMWKSQTLVTGGLHHRRGDLSPDLFRQSKEQFSLYLAGVSFWHGDYFRACTYAAGAWRSRVLYRLFPYAVQSLWRRLIRSRQSPPRRMAPGISLDSSTLPQPLIPYDRIYGAERTENSPGPVRDFAERLLQSRRWQSFTVILAFCMIAALHADNDGLWFQGDAPRHATNGLFWWDLLWALPSDPEAFTLQYYARYPVISPLTYPPLFYLLEGLAFKSFGASPQVAKFLILCFAVLAGLYTMEWSRRWIGVRAGWAGAFLAFVPGVVLWTNAVMLNMPAMALGLACLYHCRRWMESGARKQLVLAAAFLMAVLLTYFQGGCVFAICILWAALFRRNHSLRFR